ncbi:MAG: hypothetical protein OZ948_00845 [Deltaproteobacteria bacterium]|nr:hypothetical protein [Deltaproteobacteria bacterium]
MRRYPTPAGWLVALLFVPGLAQAGDAARDGLRRLEAQEQRMRLEDLRTGAHRRLEADRLRHIGDPISIERAHRRWRAEDRQRDFRRDRESEAIERAVDANEQIERATERLPGPRAAPPEATAAARDAFERERSDLENRQRLERLRRDPARLQGPGVRRYPP